MVLDPLAPDLSGLAELARGGHLDVRPVLLRVHTDLFLTAPSRPPELLRSFAALATGLIPVVDSETAGVVARKLAPEPDTPLAVLDALMARDSDLVEVVLALSPRLDRATLIATATQGTTALALALADRADLDPGLVELLLERREAAVDERLARNGAVTLSRPAIDVLVDRALDRDALAASLAARPDLTGIDKAPLYGHADEGARIAILRDVERLAGLAGKSRARGSLADAAAAPLLRAAERSDVAAFAGALAGLLGVAPEEAARLLGDPTGELLALGVTAAGASQEQAIRVFLCLDPAIGRSVARVFHLADHVRRFPRPVAERFIAAMLKRPAGRGRGKAVHLPAAAPGGASPRLGAVTPRPKAEQAKPAALRAP